VDAELKGVPFEKKLVTRTAEGIALQPLYSRVDLEKIPHLETKPGEAPYLRGTHNQGYKNSSWEYAQEIAADDASAFNAALLNDLLGGQTSVVLVADAATRCGLDSDEAGEISACPSALPISDIKDLSTALANVDLKAVPLHLRAGFDARALGAIYLSYAKAQNLKSSSLRGSLTADPLGEWVRSGSLPASLDSLYDGLAAWSKEASEKAPKLHAIGVNARPWLEAGGNAVQELAYALATAVEYLRALQARGVPVKTSAAQMSFSFGVGQQFFIEVSKFRAFRLLWSRVLKAYGHETAATGCLIQARTCLYDKTLTDSNVNMLRSTTEALSAVLGSVDTLHIGPVDEVTGATTELSRRIARNIHTLLSEEFHFDQTADPAGGSWYIEKFTDELARKAWALFQDIEKKGGFAACLRSGEPQKAVAAVAAEKTEAVSKRRSGLVGTNLFPNLKETPLVRKAADPSHKSAHSAALKARRPANVSLANTEFSSLLDAAEKGASVGQISKALFGGKPGKVDPIQAISCIRASSGFEELRAASAAFAAKTGARPKVFLAKIGPVLQHKARADFSAGFFAVAGFESIAKQSFDTPEAAAQAAAASGSSIAVLCSTDDTYPVLVPAFAKAVKAAKPGITVVLAGLPADKAVVEQFKTAGIDEFIHIRANVREVLSKFLKQIGAL
jgi:methylmalonyl-CoA mutase